MAIKTCGNIFATVALDIPAGSAHLIRPARIAVALVIRLTVMLSFVQQHTVHGDEFAVVDVAILVLVTFFCECI